MKKTLTLIVALALGLTLMAQTPGGGNHRHHKRPEPPKVEEMVSNLSAVQKKKLETIAQDSKKQTEKIQKELESVRNNIRKLMNQDGDQSDKLFPLIDREAALQAEMTKAMYRTRQEIDKVLSPEQLAEFRDRLKADRKKHTRPERPVNPKRVKK